VVVEVAVQGTRRRRPGGERTAALADKLQQRGSRSLECADRSRKSLRRSPGGQDSPRPAGDEVIGAVHSSPAAVSSRSPDDAEARSEIAGLGKLLDGEREWTRVL
jgi:hypothetical protein